MMKLSEQITNLEAIVDAVLSGRGIGPAPRDLAATRQHYETQATVAKEAECQQCGFMQEEHFPPTTHAFDPVPEEKAKLA
jgi:DNA-binding transcriptional LysR family regulator